MIHHLQETGQALAKLDRIKLFSEQYFRLSRLERERLMELESEHFINVIHSIQEKGKRQTCQIQKLIQLQGLRRQNVMKNKLVLDNFGEFVMDSKIIQAARVIQKAMQRLKEGRALKLRLEQGENFLEQNLFSHNGNNKTVPSNGFGLIPQFFRELQG